MLDPSNLVAIDMHVHAMVSESGENAAAESFRKSAQDLFGAASSEVSLDDTAQYYRERRMACVIFPVDSGAGTGRSMVPNAEVLDAAARNSDVMIPFASVDPWKGKAGAAEAEHLITTSGVRGFKFHPLTQAFFPNDRHAYEIYEVIAAAGLPCVFHTGQTGIGAGMPGGGGIRLKYANPIFLDDVAADFPTLPIIMAHPSVPWQDEALSVALHKPLVYIDLSGWSPKYFPPQLIQYSNTLLKDKVLFGSDFPLLTPDRWMEAFDRAAFRDEVKPLILRENAARLLNLTGCVT